MKLTAIAIFASALSASAAVPVVSGVSLSQNQDSSRRVNISYTLTDGPAVVTLDIQTNVSGNVWASIGEENFTTLSGDVNAYVTNSSCSIVWDARTDWPDNVVAASDFRAVVTAWSPDDTPDYMVVDLSSDAARRVSYYVSANALPGGLLANTIYRNTKLVMRRIHAKGRTFSMGAACEIGSSYKEMPYSVTLTNDYYIGVFELTQTQWHEIYGTPFYANCRTEGAMRPMENLSYVRIRENSSNTADSSHYWPEDPHPQSYLGLLRNRTKCGQFEDGIDFDMPSRAQWQFACRAGTSEGYWNNGMAILDTTTDPNLPGRYKKNQAVPDNDKTASMGVTNCTAICGSYEPNAWGLYDMHGNVWEFCLDWYTDNPSTLASLAGAVNTTGTERTRCGGCWRANPSDCRASYAYKDSPTTGSNHVGVRLWCRAGLR